MSFSSRSPLNRVVIFLQQTVHLFAEATPSCDQLRAATPTARQGNPAGGEMQARVVRIDYRTPQQLSHVRVTSVQ